MMREGYGDPKSNFILSTIHSSKGLEYTRVYLADMLAGVIPSQIPGRGCVPDSPEANAYEEDVSQSLAAGMNAHLAKPIEPQVILDTLAGYIGSKN